MPSQDFRDSTSILNVYLWSDISEICFIKISGIQPPFYHSFIWSDIPKFRFQGLSLYFVQLIFVISLKYIFLRFHVFNIKPPFYPAYIWSDFSEICFINISGTQPLFCIAYLCSDISEICFIKISGIEPDNSTRQIKFCNKFQKQHTSH